MKKILNILFINLILFTGVNLMAQEKFLIATDIYIQGNKSTKDYIILRELCFNKNDSLLFENWSTIKTKCEENLINTSLFHSAIVDTATIDGKTVIKIEVSERWYIFPMPLYEFDERNLNSWIKSDKISRASFGLFFIHSNFRGRMENLQLLFETGYNQRIGVAYTAPYINKKKTLGLMFQTTYTLRHEVNVFSKDNKQVFLKLTNRAIRKSLSAFIQLNFRPDIYASYTFEFGYDKYIFDDSLLIINPDYSSGNLRNTDFLHLMLKAKNDHRDYKSYPLKGHYEDLEAWGYGFGLLENNNLNVYFLKTSARKYFKLSKRFYYAAGFFGKISSKGKQPFIIQEGLGYSRDFVRGYEYYVQDGQSYAVFKHNLKYNIIKTRYLNLKFLKWKKFNKIPFTFYLNIFNDYGYSYNRQSYDKSNTMVNRWLYSSGIGLDWKSYYDTVSRLEFTINHLGERGFYFHVIAPI